MRNRLSTIVLVLVLPGLIPLAGCLDAGEPASTVKAGSNASTEPARNTTYDPGWPSLENATIRPGVGIVDGDGYTGTEATYVCTSNFLFKSPDNRSLYLGTAAHCFSDEVEINDTVEIANGEANGTLVYNGFIASGQESGVTTDFALVRIHDDDRSKVHPALIHYGGPTGLANSSRLQPGDWVHTYGNSTNRPINDVDPREGIVHRNGSGRSVSSGQNPPVQDKNPDGFSAYFLPHSIHGDSGSPVIDSQGQALGVMKAISLVDGSNAGTDLDLSLRYMHNHTNLTVELVTWPLFNPDALGPPLEAPMPSSQVPAAPGAASTIETGRATVP